MTDKKITIRLKAHTEGGEHTGIYGADGKEYPVGHEMTFTDPDGSHLKSYGSRAVVVSGDVGELTPATGEGEPGPRYVAKEKGGGWWAVYEGDEEVSKSIRPDAGEAFNNADAEAQEAFVKSNPKV